MARRRTSYRPRRASGGYGRTSRFAGRPAVRRAYSGRTSAPARQIVEIRHVMAPGGLPAGYHPGVAGTVGVAAVPAAKKGKTF